jgi:hypothetical protein
VSRASLPGTRIVMKTDHRYRLVVSAAVLLGAAGAGYAVATSSSPAAAGPPAGVGVIAVPPPNSPSASPPVPHPHASNLPWQVLAASGGDTVLDGAALSLGECADGSVTWIDHRLARFELHPGGLGGPGWSQPNYIPADRRAGLIASFNGGFKIGDSKGGFYLDGRTVRSLRSGAASEFFGADGTFNVGAYGRDGAAGGSTTGVRQNLKLLVDNGAAAADIDSLRPWGATMGGAACVRRSGVGVTAAGDAVYAIGSPLSPHGLAQLLTAAGAVRAMELDINPHWPSFDYYTPDARPHNFGNSSRRADLYLTPTDRDFVAVYLR